MDKTQAKKGLFGFVLTILLTSAFVFVWLNAQYCVSEYPDICSGVGPCPTVYIEPAVTCSGIENSTVYMGALAIAAFISGLYTIILLYKNPKK